MNGDGQNWEKTGQIDQTQEGVEFGDGGANQISIPFLSLIHMYRLTCANDIAGTDPS